MLLIGPRSESSPRRSSVPAGTWQLDATHSSVGFSIRHAVVNTFRSHFKDVAATLVARDDGSVTLTGTVQVASIDVDDPNFKGHLMAPDFFAADEFPRSRSPRAHSPGRGARWPSPVT